MADPFHIASLGSSLNLGVGGVSPAASRIGPSAQEAGSISFADALKSSGSELVGALQNAEATSMQGMKGEASAYEVATAVMEAEKQVEDGNRRSRQDCPVVPGYLKNAKSRRPFMTIKASRNLQQPA